VTGKNGTRRILVLTLSFGSGHVQAARTVAEELRRRAPEAEVRVLDALAVCRRVFRAGYVIPYWLMIRYAPSLWDGFFTRRVGRMESSTAPAWAFLRGCPRVFKEIAEFKPEIIVAAEVAACEMAVIAKRNGLTKARLINVITDYEAEPVWVKPEVDCYAVPDAYVRDQLRTWGASDENITLCGIPTGAEFDSTPNREVVVESNDRRGDPPLVLIMGGGMGPTRMDHVAKWLCESGRAMHIVAVTGHDTCARRRLARLRPHAPVSLSVLGWTDNIASLMKSAAVLATKPGGLTAAEAAMCALPIIVFDPIPGPERRNAARLKEAGAGVVTEGAKETALAVLALLRDEEGRRKMSSCAERLARPHAAAAIAKLAMGDSWVVKQ
jgi:processive 1,2-diacylglycerol beta-glucosyltransferase